MGFLSPTGWQTQELEFGKGKVEFMSSQHLSSAKKQAACNTHQIIFSLLNTFQLILQLSFTVRKLIQLAL